MIKIINKCCEVLKVLVTQSCLTLCDSMDCSPPGSSVSEILQARLLEWVAIPLSRESSRSRDRTRSPALRQILYRLSHQGSTNLISKKINADFHLSDTAKYSTNNPQHRCLWHLPKLGNHTSTGVCIDVYVFMHMCVCVCVCVCV